ncbi:dihydrofolate reductase family protein [Actinocrinis puniceicyclus]|uniref:Dihydrofolate reductase family protein n=1 Tax=Actinocrinis puniceicyclus TaxID=977794 RepID=A0A8J8BC91_9ACTN|nr:dihydrofolate reductase family protein [Actinocrinis puniceicyclus]MBS2962871.1 dihydrofolate reductase family protein [Actinocrinis puniceicyclus]
MGKIVVSENVSLDGAFEDPTDSRFGGWLSRIGEKDRQAWAQVQFEEARRCEALLMGGRSYTWFAERWVTRGDEWAQRLRSLPKYVVSSTLEVLDWENTTLLKGDMAKEVAKLKQDVTGEIVVYGSGRLVKALVEQDLVDELRLMVYPVVVGVGGRRLLAETSTSGRMRLVDSRTVGDGLAYLAYEFPRDA